MKKYFQKSVTLKIAALFALLLAIIIVHSCKKDNKSTQQTDPVIAQAKIWYENAYPLSNTNGKLIIQSISHDLSQWVKPNWQHTASYARLGKNVIEMPIDPNSKFGSTLKIGTKLLNKAYSRSYFLLMNDGKNYEAYILTILADSGYVNNDLNKLAHNSYRKLDADFSGKLLYFTPKGVYLGGYGYKNGQLLAPSTETSQQTGTQKTQSISTDKLSPDNMVEQCTDWYIAYFTDGVFQYADYLTTTCVNVDDGTGDDGGSSSSTPPPPHCPVGSHPGPPVTPPCIPQNVDAINGRHVIINFVPPPPPPPDGGAPPPPTTQDGCSVDGPAAPCPPVADTIDNLTDPCLRSVAGRLFKNNLTGKIAGILNDVFGSTDKVNLTFDQNTDSSAGAAPAQTVGAPPSNGMFSATITLNMAQIGEGSQEYKAIVMVHEVLHAYMDYNTPYMTQFQQHQAIAQKYVNDIRAFVQGLYPTLTNNDAYAIILNGIADVYPGGVNNTAYQALLTTYSVSDAQGSYLLEREGVTGTPCGK